MAVILLAPMYSRKAVLIEVLLTESRAAHVAKLLRAACGNLRQIPGAVSLDAVIGCGQQIRDTFVRQHSITTIPVLRVKVYRCLAYVGR